MKKRWILIMLTALALFLIAGSAMAATATEVRVNNVWLTAARPYLWQGETAAQSQPPSDTTGYVHTKP